MCDVRCAMCDVRCAMCDVRFVMAAPTREGNCIPHTDGQLRFSFSFPWASILLFGASVACLGGCVHAARMQLSVPFAFRSPRLVTRFTTRTTTGGWTPRGPRTYLFGVRGSAGVCSLRFSGDVAAALCAEYLRCRLSVYRSGLLRVRGSCRYGLFRRERACVPSGSVPRFTSFFARRVRAVLPVVVHAADVRRSEPRPCHEAFAGECNEPRVTCK